MIAAARGQKVKARRDLERALSINAHFAPFAPQQAREALAKLGASA